MNKTFRHLPEHKQREIECIRDRILELANNTVEILIMFGSYARGDWVEDQYVEDYVFYEYQSDVDLLVVVKDERQEKNHGLWNRIENTLLDDEHITVPVSIIVDTIDFVNMRLKEGNYFYGDIKREGILLYDSGKYSLQRSTPLTNQKRKKLAHRDFSYWFNKAQELFEGYHYNLSKEYLNLAAFHLHQMTEAFFVAVLLVLTGYRPKTHDLKKIERKIIPLNAAFTSIFPKEDPKDRRLFTLLRKAYVDARYKADYKITARELEWLEKRISILKKVAKKVCTEYINTLV